MLRQVRQQKLLRRIQYSNLPVTGDELSQTFNVSRQIIVSDIQQLRKEGHEITSSKSGYSCPPPKIGEKYERIITVRHTKEEMTEEVKMIVSNGAIINDVSVIHPHYGRISKTLMLTSIEDCESFSEQMERDGVKMLADLTNGLHQHVISAKTEKILDNAVNDLHERGFLVEDE